MDNKLIQGVIVTSLNVISDERGSVLHMLRSDEDSFTKFGGCYFSEINPNVIKGWKMHKLQTQNLTVPIGRIKFVLFDNRKFSETLSMINVFEIGRPDNFFRLTIPPNIWYSLKCISESSSIIVNCADIPHESNECEVHNIENNFIPFSWSNNI